MHDGFWVLWFWNGEMTWGNTIEHLLKKLAKVTSPSLGKKPALKMLNCPKYVWEQKQSLAGISVKSCFQNFLRNPTLKL